MVGSLTSEKLFDVHYYRHIKESVNTDEWCGAKEESDGESEDEEMRKNSTMRRTIATMNLFSTIWMRRVTLNGQFSSYQMTKYVGLSFKVHET